MHILLTVLRKRPEITTEQFRAYMEHEYGPTYSAMPQTREYVQYFVDDLAADDAEEPIDAIVRIAFDSVESMQEALDSDRYRRAHDARKRYIRESSVGIHSAVVTHEAKLV
jgi:hypothetical protein